MQPDLSLETLLLRHHSATVAAAGSLWTCIAVVAAAVYFWRVRSSAVVSTAIAHRLSEPPSPPQRLQENPIPPPTEDKRKEGSWHEDKDSCQMSFTTKGIIFELRGCALDDQEEEMEDGQPSNWSLAADGDFDGGSVVVFYGGEVMRDLGWHKYQNAAALNGNVVRLWDDVRRSRF